MSLASKIQTEELDSDRYHNIIKFLISKYWNRKHYDLEERLFQIINIDDNPKIDLVNRYGVLKNFLESLPESIFRDNIFLEKAYLFLHSSRMDCKNIVYYMNEELSTSDERLSIQSEVPQRLIEKIPERVHDQIFINYDGKEFEYVDVLDDSHRHVYDEYNDYVSKIKLLLENIYLLQITNIISNNDIVSCKRVNLYNPSNSYSFITSFNIKRERKLNENR